MWCTYRIPSRRAVSSAHSLASSKFSPRNSTSAPSARIDSTFIGFASSGIAITQRMPKRFAPYASDCPWLPVDAPIIPRARSSSLSVDARYTPPRTLNAPIGCRFSSFRYASQPSVRESVRLCWSGVRGR